MFSLEPPLEPIYNEWNDCTLPKLCKFRIEDVCNDIIKKGDNTIYQEIYNIVYQIVESEVEDEHFNQFYEY